MCKARRAGVPVPAVHLLDERRGCVFMERLAGGTVRDRLRGMYQKRKAGASPGEAGEADACKPYERGVAEELARLVVRLHDAGVVHGDLTTSNFMMSGPEAGGGKMHVIDFGLAGTSTSNEDRAVDLYVLERAVATTHPGSGAFVREVMSVYKNESKSGDKVMQRLAEVRARGRKRECFG